MANNPTWTGHIITNPQEDVTNDNLSNNNLHILIDRNFKLKEEWHL